MPNDLAISRTCTTVGKRGGIAIFGSLICAAIIDRGLSSEIKSDRTDHIALHKGALCGVFDVVCRKIAGTRGRRIEGD
jgi:hypothetical protein